ncbi:putative phage repressor [Chthoniobacter flavus Ellin428]|uniref:Putative phage repressor n=1 Tax=Chthoniobacter flavus Ellin428 TaxID=497964 RepID=B4DA78_9BACT|nr:S24 family peptidase [Chthoniobacter flavus]EDY16705.1 putative phage repressor [Chthoniobacter flavus Ellin428]TCO87271.1 phage repressor protein C with HTH and peptisase S24 domain [Chthoniobacter flavus]
MEKVNKSESFSTRLLNWRVRHHLNQKEASQILDIGRSYVSELENGREPGDFLRTKLERYEALTEEEVKAKIVNKSAYVDKETPAPRLVETPPDYSPRSKLREALRRRELSAGQLAKLIGYKAPIVENVVHGTGRISESMAEKIEEVLDHEITKEELMAGSETPITLDPTGFRGTMGMKPSTPGMRKVPLISWAAAGSLHNASAFDEDYDGEAIETNVPGRVFSVKIEGDSMYPEINPGDIAVVRSDIEPRPGQVVLVRTLDGDVWCKRYSTRDGNRFVVLSSINDTYRPFEISAESIAWIYPVKQVIRNYS